MTRSSLCFVVGAGVLLLAVGVAGCATDDTVRVAFVAKDTATAPHDDLDALAAYLEAELYAQVDVFFFTSSNAALAALHAGQADIASVDGAAAWLGWKQLGLEAIGAEVRSDGRTHYIASAWVHVDSRITAPADLTGVDSCHTGATKSAGMLMPMSYLIANGIVDTRGYADDISVVAQMASDFFGTATIGGAYEGYEGALRCLSEGVGDVAFIRDTTPADYCTAPDDRDWCLPLDQYRRLVDFGPVPEHPIMVSPALDDDMVDALADALFAMGDSPDGAAILDGVFGTALIAPVTTEEHLGAYGALIEPPTWHPTVR